MPEHIHIGTSGWNYKHWKNVFYPDDLPQKEWLKHYQKHLQTVEINNSFYRLPKVETFEKWRESVDKDFVFAVKASRYITHMKKLKDTKESLKNMLERFNTLKSKLGPILFQLPPNWNFNEDRLMEFVLHLPQKFKCTFEFRNQTWLNNRTLQILRDRNLAFCIYDLAGFQSEKHITADFVYVRLHGPTDNKYEGKYSNAGLADWARQIKEWRNQNIEVYVYFDNDDRGFAIQNAIELNEILK